MCARLPARERDGGDGPDQRDKKDFDARDFLETPELALEGEHGDGVGDGDEPEGDQREDEFGGEL